MLLIRVFFTCLFLVIGKTSATLLLENSPECDVSQRQMVQQGYFSKIRLEGRPEYSQGDMVYIKICDESSRGVGFINLQAQGNVAHIRFINVFDEYQSRGYGSKALNLLFSAVQGFGADYVTLDVNPENKIARHVYEKQGFIYNTLIKRKEGEMLAMIKDLSA